MTILNSPAAEELRKELQNRSTEYQCLRGRGQSRNVALVPISWYNLFIKWINDSSVPVPVEIDTTNFFNNDNLNLEITWKRDFEVVETSLWQTLLSIFVCPKPVIRRIAIDPRTCTTTIILYPIILEMVTCKGSKSKTTSHEWFLGDMKKHLCIAIRVVNSENEFVDPESKTPISDDMTIGEYFQKYGNKILLRAKEIDSANQPLYHGLSLPSMTQSRPLSSIKLLDLPKTKVSSMPSRSQLLINTVPKAIGLTNNGNTCYFNAALQSIIHLRPLCNLVLSPKFDQQINTTNKDGTGGKIAMAFKSLIKQLCFDKSSAFNPRDFAVCLKAKYTQFAEPGQHDAQELLCAVLDGIHEDIARPDDGGVTPRTASVRTRYPGTKASAVDDLFGGVFSSSIDCPACGARERVFDPFTCVSLPLPSKGGAPSLLDCLAEFARGEELDDDNRWRCGRCGRSVRAVKRMAIERFGSLLVVHLKRFGFGPLGPSKIGTAVEYPDEIDAGRVCAGATGSLRLASVVFHVGSINAGHYTAAAEVGGEWFYFNDSSVRKVPRSSVHNEAAYILIYQRIQ